MSIVLIDPWPMSMSMSTSMPFTFSCTPCCSSCVSVSFVHAPPIPASRGSSRSQRLSHVRSPVWCHIRVSASLEDARSRQLLPLHQPECSEGCHSDSAHPSNSCSRRQSSSDAPWTDVSCQISYQVHHLDCKCRSRDVAGCVRTRRDPLSMSNCRSRPS